MTSFREVVHHQHSPYEVELLQTVGRLHDYGRLRLRGPFLMHEEDDQTTVWLPPPLDLLLSASDASGIRQTHTLRPMPQPVIPAEMHCGQVKPPTGQPSPVGDVLAELLFVPLHAAMGGLEGSGVWLKASEYLEYLRGVNPRLDTRRELFTTESRLGIQLAPGRRTAAEGRLYTAQFTRLWERTSLLINIWLADDGDAHSQETDLAALLPMDKGLLQLGGEARAARYERLPDEALGTAFEQVCQGHEVRQGLDQQTPPYRFKLGLLTPAVFQNGWFPDGLEYQTDATGTPQLRGTLHGLPCTVVTAKVGKPVPISGWDIANNRPKPMLRAVPTGSVYYCETHASPTEIIAACHFQTLDTRQEEAVELPKIGFGLTTVGVWDYAVPF